MEHNQINKSKYSTWNLITRVTVLNVTQNYVNMDIELHFHAVVAGF